MATVDILLRTPGGPAAAGPSGGAPPGSSGGGVGAKDEKKGKDPAGEENKKGLAKVGDRLKGAANFFKKNLGLQFGMSSMLKQSQVFTSFIGVIFQLMGALIDVILAPLLPLFFPVIRLIGAAIPYVQKFMENVAGWALAGLNTVLGWYDKAKNWVTGKIDEWNEAWRSGPKEFGTFLWDKVWGGLTWVWDKLKNDLGPWLWDQIKGLGDSVWQWLQTTGGRIFGWFAQAYIMLGFVRTGVNKIVAWAVKFGWKILKGLATGIFRMIMWGIKAIPKIFAFLGRQVAKLIKIMFPIAGKIIIAIAKAVGRLFKFFVKLIAKAALGLIKFIGKSIFWVVKMIGKGLIAGGKFIISKMFGVGKAAGKGLFELLKKFVQTTVKNLLTKLGGLLGKLPLIGGTLKKIGGLGKSLFGGVTKLAGGIGKAVGGKGLLKAVGTVAKMSKAIPVLGSVATLGFGAVETYSNFKNHGWKAGLATAGKTIAATTLAATGNTVASMAVDIGGTLAINKFLKKKADEGAVGGPAISPAGMAATAGGAIVLNINTANGETVFEQTIASQNTDDMFNFDLSNDLAAADQTA